MKTFIAILFLTTLFSCKNNSTNNELNSCKDNALAEVIYLDIYMQSQLYLDMFLKKQTPSDTNVKFITSANPNSISFPFTLTVSFGSEDVLGDDSKFRRGDLVLKVNSLAYDNTLLSLKEVAVSFTDFYLDHSNVLGTFTITNKGLNGKNNYTFDLDTKAGIIINSNGTMSWESAKVLELTAGASTPNNILDDTYSLTGNVTGKDFKGTDFKATISTAMMVDPNCKWFIKTGKMSVEPNQLDVRNLDYGTGTCTGQVSVQIKEEAFSFSIQ
ncbi:MAG: hypothetical protein NT150_00695 [Bacteroidetes bacterium]|nr:hypothetical protein [Bacteroidota bacterium]